MTVSGTWTWHGARYHKNKCDARPAATINHANTASDRAEWVSATPESPSRA